MRSRNVVALLFACCAAAAGCGPKHVDESAIPPPPPAYGEDPYQEATAKAAPAPAQTVAPLKGKITIMNIGGAAPVPPPVKLSETEATAYMKNIVHSLSAKILAGFQLEGEIPATLIETGKDKQFAVTVGEDTCIRILVVADPGVSKIETFLFEGESVLDRDTSKELYKVVSACSGDDKDVVLMLKAAAGSGWFMVWVYSKQDDGTVKKTMDGK